MYASYVTGTHLPQICVNVGLDVEVNPWINVSMAYSVMQQLIFVSPL